MLQVHHLKIIHNKDYRVLIDDLSFAVNPGDKIVVIGEEGEGKSTLLKGIYSPRSIADYAIVEGSITASDEKIAYLPQELPRDKENLKVYEYMLEEPFFLEMNPAEVSAMTRAIGIDSSLLFSEQLMKTLSGGEKIKVQIAKILASRPSILLLDEPSNDIDVETLEWAETFINESKMGIMFVSHDETLIENTANRVIHIEQIYHKTIPRHTVANIPYKQYIEERLHSFELQETRSKMEKRQQRIAEEKWRKIYQRVEHEQNVISRGDPSGGRLLKKKMHGVKSQGKRLEKRRNEMADMPHYEHEINLKFDYEVNIPSRKTLLSLDVPTLSVYENGEEKRLSSNIQLTIRGNEKVCIVGKNGVGKTTLLRYIMEKMQDVKDVRFAYMPQDYGDILDFGITPKDYLIRTKAKEESVIINNRLSSLRFTTEDASRRIGELSGGQKAKLLLLSLTLSGADVLILDEPTRNISPLSGPVIREMLSSFSGAIVSVSHDRKYIDLVPEKVYELTSMGLKLL